LAAALLAAQAERLLVWCWCCCWRGCRRAGRMGRGC